MEQKDYKSILSEALRDLDTTDSGGDNMKRAGTGKAVVALGMVIGDIGYKIDTLNKNLSKFNEASGGLQKWLISWTAVIAVATVALIFKSSN